MKKRTTSFLTTIVLAGLITIGSGCVKDREELIYNYNRPETGSVEIYKKSNDTYKVIYKDPKSEFSLEIIFPKGPNSSLKLTDQDGSVYSLDQKFDFGLKLEKQAGLE